MSRPLVAFDARTEQDIVTAHRRSREVTSALGFDDFAQTRLGTALSEIVRNAVIYGGGGQVELALEEDEPQALTIEVRDRGRGIEPQVLADILAGTYTSRSGLGLGMVGARRLMDRFEVESSPRGTTVRMAKRLPGRAQRLPRPKLAELSTRLSKPAPPARDAGENERLQRALMARDAHLVALERELEDTNRGVVALYAELDERAEFHRRATDLKSRLLSDVGHEIRTPIHSILSICEFLLARMDGPLTAEQDRQVTLVRATASDLSDMIDDLLDLSKAQAGRVPVRVSDFALSRVMGMLKNLMRPLATNPDVALVFDDVSALPPLSTDEAKLSQILRNFVANALKFTERGEVQVGAEPAAQDHVRLWVRDTGIGIDPHDHARVFEEFTQLDGVVERRHKGSGLGLALTKRLAMLLGGEVALDSAVGRGSTFSVTIPRVFPGEASEPPVTLTDRPGPVEDGLVATHPPCTVLMIDDDEPGRYVVRRWLSPGLNVREARVVREGLAMARAERPDVILLDVAMPEMDGFEGLAQLQADPALRDIPVIMYTGKTLTEVERGRLAAARAIVRKSSQNRLGDRGDLERALIAVGVARRQRGAS